VYELELRGEALAMAAYVGPGHGENADSEVELLRDRGWRTVARMQPGVNSVRKLFHGLSFEGRSLSFLRADHHSGDSVYRYDPVRRRYSAALFGRQNYGLAAASGGRYRNLRRCWSCEMHALPDGSGGPGAWPLELVMTDPLRFRPARSAVTPR
jgi:hypothetical protein